MGYLSFDLFYFPVGLDSGDEQRLLRPRRRHRNLPDSVSQRLRHGQLHLLHGRLLQRSLLSGEAIIATL